MKMRNLYKNKKFILILTSVFSPSLLTTFFYFVFILYEKRLQTDAPLYTTRKGSDYHHHHFHDIFAKYE
jgi:hypothetical protein